MLSLYLFLDIKRIDGSLLSVKKVQIFIRNGAGPGGGALLPYLLVNLWEQYLQALPLIFDTRGYVSCCKKLVQ